jgi:23S rRNA pseudouridine1911/1915/1917 synthase
MPPHRNRSPVKHFIAGEATTIRECLRKHFRLDEEAVEGLFTAGAIYSDKKRVFEDRPLPKGGYLRIHLQPKRFPVAQVDWAKTILAETPDYLVVCKPAGVPVHATVDNTSDNALQCLRAHTGLNLLVTQRLDLPVSGVLVFAKNPDFQKLFNHWLAERKVEKHYRALVSAVPATGLHVHFQQSSDRSPRRFSLIDGPGWLRCEMTVHSTTPTPGGSDVAVQLHTGRTHQIRGQLALLGCPILGDKLYGSRAIYPANPRMIALASVRLGIPDRKGQVIFYDCPPPWA